MSANADHTASVTLFEEIWKALIAKRGSNLRFPKEVLWLGGAPGCGKGTHTATIMRERGFTAGPVVMSDLLNTPEMKKIKDAGKLVGDREVIGILLETLLDPKFANGVVVDGFPRTRAQARCIRLLFARIQELTKKANLPPTSFTMFVLMVSESEAVRRQLERGERAKKQNEQVKATGKGQLQELRSTDTDPEAARSRFKVFLEQSFDALESLKDAFPFFQISSEGSIEQTTAAIKAAFASKK